MGKITDIQGMRFHHLVVLRFDKIKNRRAYWICKCDCGNEKSIPSHNLLRGMTKGCGCLNGRCKGLPIGKSVANQALARVKQQAKSRNLLWRITDEYAFNIMGQPCFYCGNELLNTSKGNHLLGEYRYNGIDRVDNTKGYEEGNVVACCKHCNIAKHQMTINQFRKWIIQIYRHWASKPIPIWEQE